MTDAGTTGKTEIRLPRGTYSKLARRHRVSPQHVRAVALGLKTSARIALALEKFRQRQVGQEARQNVA